MIEVGIVLVALAASPQPNAQAAPLGWICRASKKLTETSSLELRQAVDSGGGTFAIEVELRLESADGNVQTLHWTPDKLSSNLREPRSASFSIKMTRRPRTGSIVLANSQDTIQTSLVFENFTPPNRGQAWIMVREPNSLRRLWAKSGSVACLHLRTRRPLPQVELPNLRRSTRSSINSSKRTLNASRRPTTRPTT